MKGRIITVDYKLILDAINEYEGMTPLEVQNNVKPIIKSYNKDFLSNHLNVSKELLYKVCKPSFVKNEGRILFTTYIKIMAFGVNQYYIEKPHRKPRQKRKRISPEEHKENLKKYQHKYYLEVTKKKRAEIEQRKLQTQKKCEV